MRLIREHNALRSTSLMSESGTVYVEFLLAGIPFFVLFLGMVQMALMYIADIVVDHAATTATRAAIVVLDDDPEDYDDADRRQINMDGNSSSGGVGDLIGIFGGSGNDGAGLGLGGGGEGGPRHAAIRSAASFPLLAISPSLGQLTGDRAISRAIGDPNSRGLVGAGIYNRSALSVTYPTEPGSEERRDEFGREDNVTVRVTYLFHCGIPVVARMACETYASLRYGPAAAAIQEIIEAGASGDISLAEVQARIDRVQLSSDRHERYSPAMEDLRAGAPSADLMNLTALTGARFIVIQSEATMPLQSARYRYQ